MYDRVRLSLLLATLFLLGAPSPIQSVQERSQAQRVVHENPEVIRLEFAPLTRQISQDIFEKISGPFKTGSKITFKLIATNTSFLELLVVSTDLYSQNKPRLLRDNQEVPYRSDKAELIKTKHTKDWEGVSVRGIKLKPNEPKFLETFDVNDWYEPLGPGRYVLSTQHRFVPGGKWVDSETIVFEVHNVTKP